MKVRRKEGNVGNELPKRDDSFNWIHSLNFLLSTSQPRERKTEVQRSLTGAGWGILSKFLVQLIYLYVFLQ